jgi:hypothetical protein
VDFYLRFNINNPSTFFRTSQRSLTLAKRIGRRRSKLRVSLNEMFNTQCVNVQIFTTFSFALFALLRVHSVLFWTQIPMPRDTKKREERRAFDLNLTHRLH